MSDDTTTPKDIVEWMNYQAISSSPEDDNLGSIIMIDPRMWENNVVFGKFPFDPIVPNDKINHQYGITIEPMVDIARGTIEKYWIRLDAYPIPDDAEWIVLLHEYISIAQIENLIEYIVHFNVEIRNLDNRPLYIKKGVKRCREEFSNSD